MVDKRREIFIKVEEVSNILDTLTTLKEKEEVLKELFKEYDSLTLAENKIVENWTYYFEDINQKLDHTTL